ncbi:MAG: copper resistance protein CopC [Nitriliruptoraceae bacterium]
MQTWPRDRRRTLLIAMLALLAWVALAVPAAGHAFLVATDPADGATLPDAPEQFALDFDEAVEVPLDGVRLFDAAGARLAVTPAVDGGTSIVIDLPPLSDGAYVLTWRVVSDDGHPVAGTVTFSVGTAAGVDEALLAELTVEDASISPVTQALRALTYAVTLLAAGLAVFLAWLVPPSTAVPTRVSRMAAGAAIAGVVASSAAFVAQVMSVTGRGLAEAMQPQVITEMLGTPFGQSAVLRVIWTALTAVLLLRRAHRRVPAVTGIIAIFTFVIDGHQRVVDPVALLVGADLVHLAVGALWIGAVVGLVLVLRGPPAVAPVVAIVDRVSAAGLVSAAIIVVTGVMMAVPLVRVPSALATTAYGRVLLVKAAAVVIVLAIAAVNRWRLVPAISNEPEEARAWRRLRLALGIEIGVLALVVSVSGVLATTPPAAQVIGASGIFVADAPLTDTLTAELVIDPNEVGRNAVHLYVFGVGGQPAADVDGALLELTHAPSGTGPVRVEPFAAGPGHWVANVDDFVLPGRWTVEVVVGTGRFDEARATFTTTIVD